MRSRGITKAYLRTVAAAVAALWITAQAGAAPLDPLSYAAGQNIEVAPKLVVLDPKVGRTSRTIHVRLKQDEGPPDLTIIHSTSVVIGSHAALAFIDGRPFKLEEIGKKFIATPLELPPTTANPLEMMLAGAGDPFGGLFGGGNGFGIGINASGGGNNSHFFGSGGAGGAGGAGSWSGRGAPPRPNWGGGGGGGGGGGPDQNSGPSGPKVEYLVTETDINGPAELCEGNQPCDDTTTVTHTNEFGSDMGLCNGASCNQQTVTYTNEFGSDLGLCNGASCNQQTVTYTNEFGSNMGLCNGASCTEPDLTPDPDDQTSCEGYCPDLDPPAPARFAAFDIAQVAEPTPLAAIGLGLTLFWLALRRRRAA